MSSVSPFWDLSKNSLGGGWNCWQSFLHTCKRKMIMSPLSKVEMSPLIAFKGLEVLYGGTKDEYQRSRPFKCHETDR